MKRVIIFSFALVASQLSFANADMNLSVSCSEVVAAKVENCVANDVIPAVCELSIQMPEMEAPVEVCEVAPFVINS